MTINCWETKSQNVFYTRTSCLSVLWILSGIHVDLPSVNLCKHFYSIVKYNKINPCQLRATSFLRLLFTMENRTFLFSPSPIISSFPQPFILSILGGNDHVLLKGDPVSSASPFLLLRKSLSHPVPFIFMNFGYIYLGLGLPHR